MKIEIHKNWEPPFAQPKRMNNKVFTYLKFMLKDEFEVGDMVIVPFYPESLRNSLERRGRYVKWLMKELNSYYVWRTK